MRNNKLRVIIDPGAIKTSDKKVSKAKKGGELLQYQLFSKWLQAFKKTQRPLWVDPSINSCFICEKEFSITNRQHHCRKCGTAVCSGCAENKVALPELAYSKPQLVCNNCFEGMNMKRFASQELQRQRYYTQLSMSNAGRTASMNKSAQGRHFTDVQVSAIKRMNDLS